MGQETTRYTTRDINPEEKISRRPRAADISFFLAVSVSRRCRRRSPALVATAMFGPIRARTISTCQIPGS